MKRGVAVSGTFLGIMLALIRRLLENVGGYRIKEGVLGKKFLVKVPFSFDFFTFDEFLFKEMILCHND